MLRAAMFCCAIAAPFAANATFTDGELDASFAGNGKAVVGFSDGLNTPQNAEAWAVALQNGKIVLAGNVNLGGSLGTALARLNANGSLDTTFATGGRALGLIAKSAGVIDSALALAIQADGKILAAGYVGHKGYVMRLLVDGGLDTSFSGDGIVTYPATAGASTTAFSSVAVTASGTIITSGTYDDGSGSAPAVLNLLMDGSGNILFAQDLTTVSAGGTGEVAMKLQPDGKAVMVTENPSGCVVVRDDIDTTLTLDPTFGTGGTKSFSWNLGGLDFCFALEFQRDGAIIVAGEGQDATGRDRATVTRLMPDGTLDSTFGKQAFAFVSTDSGIPNLFTGILVQSNQDIVLTGTAGTTDPAHAPADFAALRLLPDGSLDTTFTATTTGSSLGKVVFGFETTSNGRDDQCRGALLLGNEIVVAGWRETSGSDKIEQFAIARLKNDDLFTDPFEP